MEWLQNLYESFYNALIPEQRYLAYLSGLKMTLLISAFAVLLGIAIGPLVAVIKVSRKNSKIDCIVMDELPAKELVESSNGALTILEGDPLFVDQYAIAVQKGNSEMLDVVNSVIKELQDNGKMDEIIASHSQAK